MQSQRGGDRGGRGGGWGGGGVGGVGVPKMLTHNYVGGEWGWLCDDISKNNFFYKMK